MDETPSLETTRLLRAWAHGDNKALTKLIPRVQPELHRLAHYLVQNERQSVTVQVTDLVQDLYVKLLDIRQLQWQHRAHFFAIAATMMRRILLDRARRKATARRGQNPMFVDFKNALEMSLERSEVLVALDDALTALSQIDPRKARIVELRFFGGLEVKETAAVVGVSPETVLRDWRLARSWILKELNR